MKPLQVLVLALLALATHGASAQTADDPNMPYELKYKFQSGETVRWKVEHRARIRTTIAGTTQTAETESLSVKAWRISEVDSDGNVTFEHLVESIRMRQQLSGRKEEVYDSTSDKEPPLEFQEAARSVGVVLSRVKMDPRGKILKRDDTRPQPLAADSQMTLPLPESPIAVGESWSFPHEVEVTLNQGAVKRIQTRQQFTLKAVKHQVATIAVETAVLTPIRDPQIEAQLIQRTMAGKVRFDIEAGRVLDQQMDLDKQVVGFHGEASSLHYTTRFAEEILPSTPTASRPPDRPKLRR